MQADIHLYPRAWREQLRGFLRGAENELTVVCPYIRQSEAAFVTDELSQKVTIAALTCLNADSIMNGALEIGGSRQLADFSPAGRVLNLPGCTPRFSSPTVPGRWSHRQT